MNREPMAPPPLVEPPPLEPKSIKVFGVLNLVFGCLGAFSAAAGLAVLVCLDPLMGWIIGMIENGGTAAAAPGEEAARLFRAMRTMMSEMAPANWINTIGTMLLSVLILVSGAKLLKRRRNAVTASNFYACSSLAFKVLGVVLYFTVVHEALTAYYEATAGLTPAGPAGGAAMLQAQKVVGAASSLAGYALAAVYPVLVLVFLNKPGVRHYLSRQGS